MADENISLTDVERTKLLDFFGKVKDNISKKAFQFSDKETLAFFTFLSSELSEDKVLKEADMSKLYKLSEKELFNNELSVYIDKIHARHPADVFKYIQKSFDENLYSDYLAAIFSSDNDKSLSEVVLSKLLKTCGFPDRDCRFAKVRREVSLRNFGISTNSLMRIDIFVELNDGGVILIENKTKSSEHGSQTVLYYEAVAQKYDEDNILPIYLTPNQATAEHPKFKSLSYRDLYEVIMLSTFSEEVNVTTQHYPFLVELYRSFFESSKFIIERAKKYRESA